MVATVGRNGFFMAAVLVIVTPSRPLWPARTLLSALVDAQPQREWIRRALTVYSVYGIRADGLAPVREKLPADASIVGLVTYDDLETSLWRPFGRRSFRHVLVSDTREQLLQQGIKCVIVNGELMDGRWGITFEGWLKRYGGQVEATIPLRLRAGRQSFDWYIVRL